MKKKLFIVLFLLSSILLNGCGEQQPNNLETFWNANIDFVLNCPDVSDELTEEDLQTLYSYYQSEQAKGYLQTMEDAIQKEKESGKWEESQKFENPLQKMQDEYDLQIQRIQACATLMNGTELSKIEDIAEVVTTKMRALEIPEMKDFIKEMGRQKIIDHNTK